MDLQAGSGTQLVLGEGVVGFRILCHLVVPRHASRTHQCTNLATNSKTSLCGKGLERREVSARARELVAGCGGAARAAAAVGRARCAVVSQSDSAEWFPHKVL